MFGIPAEHFATIVSVIGLAILGVFSEIGRRRGLRTPAKEEQTYEVAGALVDSKAVMMLAAAVEALTLQLKSMQMDAEKDRKLRYEMREQIEAVGRGFADLRHVLNDLSNQIARSK